MSPQSTQTEDPRSVVWRAIEDGHTRGRLLSVTRRIAGSSPDADDAFQDAMVQALTHAHRFRSDALVSTWLHRIAVNAALMGRRRAATSMMRWGSLDGSNRSEEGTELHPPAKDSGFWPEAVDPSPSPEEQVLALEERAQLELAMAGLGTRGRETIEAYLSDRHQRGAAAPMRQDSLGKNSDKNSGKDSSKTSSALRARLSRARGRLKELLAELDVGLWRAA